MPPFEEVWAQFCELAKRLQAAGGEASYRTWKGASGVVIMKNVFTEPRFYVGCEDYLYLWLHMACKSMCEAVVEGIPPSSCNFHQPFARPLGGRAGQVA